MNVEDYKIEKKPAGEDGLKMMIKITWKEK